jgi:3-oxoacyl-[acyl-carrier protein] reductase
VIQAIREAGGRAGAWEADLSDPAYISALFDRAERAFGPVDILVNNAAVSGEDTFVPVGGAPGDEHIGLRGLVSPSITAATHDRFSAVNSRATALMMAEFARRHAKRGASWGRIINLSTGGAYCFPGEVSYGASKAAVEAYSRSAAKELGQYGITVSIVSPGPI